MQWHQHVGNCPGVNYDPIEVSTEGAAAYLEAILRQHESVKARLLSLSKDTDIRDVAEHRKVKARLESEERFLEREAATFTKIIETWEPRALPGEAA